jgi:hypothetical protein
MDAAARNEHTPRTDEALEKIQDQLDNGEGQVETGIDVSMEREEAEKREDVAAGKR